MVIEYPCDLRDHMFLKIFKPNIADNSSIRVPVNPLGSKAVKAKLPCKLCIAHYVQFNYD